MTPKIQFHCLRGNLMRYVGEIRDGDKVAWTYKTWLPRTQGWKYETKLREIWEADWDFIERHPL